MKRLFTVEPTENLFEFKPTKWWGKVYWVICPDGQAAVDDEWDNFARQWRGLWEYGWSADGDRTLLPQSIWFENDEDAAWFLLRWS